MLPRVEVALLHWPRDHDQRAHLADAMLPRLLLVTAGETPPDPRDDLEDWIRLPADERDVAARLRALAERAERSLEATVIIDGRCLRRGSVTIPLSPGEARFAERLVVEPGRLVSRGELSDAVWPDEKAPSAKALDDVAYRLRKRLAPIGLDLVNARGRGFALQVLSPIDSEMVE
jgi:two-component system response regulator TctD